MDYKYKYLDEAMIQELDEFWGGGHQAALMAYGNECVNAYREGFKVGFTKTFTKCSLIGAAGCGVLIGAGYLGTTLVEKYKKKKTEKVKVE